MAVVLSLLGTATAHAEDLLTSQMADEARMWQSKGRLDLAEDIWRRLLITNVRNGAALMGLAQIQIKTGRLEEAEALISRAARLSPPPATLGSTTALLRAAQQRTTTAPATTLRSESPLPPVPLGDASAKSLVEPKPATPNTAGQSANTPPRKTVLAAAPRIPSEPVPPRPVEITVTPIPFRTVEATPPHGDDDTSGSMRLQASSQLLLGASVGTASTPAAPGATKKNKPRPCRPAPATNPPLPER